MTDREYVQEVVEQAEKVMSAEPEELPENPKTHITPVASEASVTSTMSRSESIIPSSSSSNTPEKYVEQSSPIFSSSHCSSEKLRVMLLFGIRPEFIRLKFLIDLLDKDYEMDFKIVHSGQHYSQELNQVFFDDLDLRKPDYNLAIGSGSHAEQAAKLLVEVEKVVLKEKPHLLVVLGDSNTVLGAIAAKKLGVKVMHVEAGMRSFDFRMPEEINRRMIDHISDYCVCYTERYRENLLLEGKPHEKVFVVGNTIVDLVESCKTKCKRYGIWAQYNFKRGKYGVVTCHRAEHVDNPEVLKDIVDALHDIHTEHDIPLIWPLYPRTKKMMEQFGIAEPQGVVITPPLGYYEFLSLIEGAGIVLTDCVDGDTLIDTDKGIKKIRDVEEGNGILNSKGAYEAAFIKSMKFKKNAVRLVACGRKLVCSHEHQIMTLDGFKQAKDIKKGEYVQINTHIPWEIEKDEELDEIHCIPKYMMISDSGREKLSALFEEKKETWDDVSKRNGISRSFLYNVLHGKRNISEDKLFSLLAFCDCDPKEFVKMYCSRNESSCRVQCNLNKITLRSLAEFVGQYLGDGNIIKKKGLMRISDKELDSLLKFQKYLNETMELNSFIEKDKRENSNTLMIHNADFANFLLYNFPEMGKYQPQRSVPDKINRSTLETQALFLRGFFSAEGGCDRLRIFLDNSSGMIMYQVQHMLLRFGIMSHITEFDGKRKRDKSRMYKLHITDRDSIFFFKKRIGFNIERKQKNLDVLSSLKASKREKTNIKWENGRAFGRVTRKTVIEGYNKKMYDLTFHEVPNFFAGNILVHNSGTAPEEAYLMGIPAVNIRWSTERPELNECESMVTTGATRKRIVEGARKQIKRFKDENAWWKQGLLGELGVARRIYGIILDHRYEMMEELKFDTTDYRRKACFSNL